MSVDRAPHRRILPLVVLGVSLAGSARVALQLWGRLDSVVLGPLALVFLGVATLGVAVHLLALVRAWRGRVPGLPLLRWAFMAVVGGWIAYLVVRDDYHRPRVELTMATAGALLATVALLAPAPPRRPPPAVRRLDVILFQCCLVAVLGELGLRAVAWVAPSPLLARSASAAAERARAHAFPPGHRRRGFACNSRGFYDHEFLTRGQRSTQAVAVIGDSFSASAVPHAYHYTTVAERDLAPMEVWNVGWASLGPAEYLHLLRHDVLPLAPEGVIVALFLGNDLGETSPHTGLDRVLAEWFDRGNVLLLEVPRRLTMIGRVEVGTALRLRETEAEPIWLHDPGREPGTFAPDVFLRIETDRARVAAALPQRRIASLHSSIRTMRAACGTIPFGLVLIPDEFMVEDGLWAELTAAAPEVAAGRHRLRQHLVAWCRDEQIPCLDLWPTLDAVPPFAGGDRHLYLARDTHWNVRGNETAGRALAPFVRELLR